MLNPPPPQKFYSQNETVTGVWIDGRNIYSKTFILDGSKKTAANWVWYYFSDSEITDLNIDEVVAAEGSCYVSVTTEGGSSFSAWQTIPRVVPDNCEGYSIGIGDIQEEVFGVLFGTSYVSVGTIYVTLSYVKKGE